MLILTPKESELTPARWKGFEPHDVLSECSRVLLDESKPMNGKRMSAPHLTEHALTAPPSVVLPPSYQQPYQSAAPVQLKPIHLPIGPSVPDSTTAAVFFTPSESIGVSTPPEPTVKQ